MRRPSVALAQALQFELKLGQREVVGEWLPKTEPGTSDITNNEKKWLRGLLWSEIDANLILRRAIQTRKGTKDFEVDLKHLPMVTEELAKMGERPANGPIVVCEWSGLPWTAHEFRRWWRQIANAAGIPKTVFNMDSHERRTRAGEKASDDDNSDHGRMGSDDHARRLIPKVAAALPKLLSDQVREDVLQEMLLDLHSGKISEAELSPKLGRRYISEYYKRYDNRYNTLSLDQPVLGKESGKLGDLISSDRAVWSEVP